MSLKNTFDLLRRNWKASPNEPKPSLAEIFGNHGKLPPQTIHIVDQDTLTQIAALHPYNRDIYRDSGRQNDFPELLRVGEPGALYFIISDEKNRFIASLTLRPINGSPESLEFAQISVQENYKNMGLSGQLLEAMRDYLNKDRKDITRIVILSYLGPGLRWVRPKLLEMSPYLRAGLFEQNSWTLELCPLRHLHLA